MRRASFLRLSPARAVPGLQVCCQPVYEQLVRHLSQMVRVETQELCKIETRCRAVQAIEREQANHLVRGEEFLIAMRPAEAHEVVSHRFGQISLGFELADSYSAMSL